jgi:DNA integrity scanning protein DisA with diadenylate cyclase activity
MKTSLLRLERGWFGTRIFLGNADFFGNADDADFFLGTRMTRMTRILEIACGNFLVEKILNLELTQRAAEGSRKIRVIRVIRVLKKNPRHPRSQKKSAFQKKSVFNDR